MKRTRLFAPALALLMLSALTIRAAQIAPPTGRFDREIAAFEQADRVKPPPPNAILFTGSSSIKRWESLAADFPDLPVINRGFGGSEVEDAIFYADRIIIPYKPKMIVIYSGDNDLDNDKTPERVAADYAKLVEKIHKALPEARIAIISIRPSFARENLMDEQRKANMLIQQLVAKDKRLAFINLFDALLSPNGRPNPAYLDYDDGLHPSPEGYAVWKKTIEPVLKSGWN